MKTGMDIARQRTLVDQLEKLAERAREQAMLAEESRKDLHDTFIAEQNRLSDMMKAQLDERG